MMLEKRRAARLVRMAARIALPIILAASAFASVAVADTGVQTQGASASWVAPTSETSADDNVVTVGSHLSGTASAEVVGLNETVFPAQSSYKMNASTLAEAQELDRLGVFGSAANQNPNPYLANLFYNYYAAENDLETVDDAAVYDEGTKAAAYIFYIDPNEEYGTPSELAQRPDIVMGVSNSTGQAYDVTMNYGTTDSINYMTWGNGASTPSQPYMCVLDIRRHTDDESLVGTRNSDGNVYETSWYYRDGDETYDPIAVVYNRGTSSSGIDYAVENVNGLAWAAEVAMQQDKSKTCRYGDPLDAANDYERYVKALKWAILSKQASGDLEKKTVALVAYVSSEGNFRLVKMNPDGDETNNFRIPEAAQDTVTDLAEELYPDSSAGLLRNDVTPAQLMAADVVICIPPLASTYNSSADDVREALANAGYSESNDNYPAIFDNSIPLGTFETEGGLYDSAESAMLVGLIQGFIYPEVLDPVDAMTYYASKLFHLKDSYVNDFVAGQLDGISLPEGSSVEDEWRVEDSISAVEDLIDEGISYYYTKGGKESIDAARPRIASTDALDDAYGYGVSDVTITVPDGATFTLTDAHRLLVEANSDGTYTIDDDDDTTLTVTLAGYRDYSKSITGANASTEITTDMMTATKTVSFTLPDGASISWVKNASGSKILANSDGTYTIDAGIEATYSVSLDGFDDLTGTIAEDATTVVLNVSDFSPESMATTINVPDRATLVVTDSSGAVVSPESNGTYKLWIGYTYTATVEHPRYETYTLSIVGGEKSKINIRLSSMTARVGQTSLTIDKATVYASDINEVDAEVVQVITLGSKVKKIAASAFVDCASLKTIKFGANVTTIGASAFSGLALLSTVTLDSNLKTIGKSAFAGCASLASLMLPAKVAKVGATAFSGCTKLKVLTVATKKLKKAKIKNSLKGSSVKTVKVKIGKAKVNKTYVKKYKKIFTKAISGKKVAVKK